jgi:hypothetical protein
MAARVRSDCRIAWVGAGKRLLDAPARSRGISPADHQMLHTKSFQSGRVDLHLKSARNGHITVALTSRGRGQLHRLRSMSTGIRAPVHEQAVDASTVTFG